MSFDTEFISFPFYRHKLELIQLASDNIVAVVDCQFLSAHLKPLLELLHDKEVILHAGNAYPCCSRRRFLA